MHIKAKLSDEKEIVFKIVSKKCYKCNKVGHFSKDCRVKTNQNSKQVRCFRFVTKKRSYRKIREKPHSKISDSCSICKKTSHTDKNCFFRKDRNKKSEKEGKVSFLATKTDRGMEWIVGSGTTSNMINNRDNISSLQNWILKLA